MWTLRCAVLACSLFVPTLVAAAEPVKLESVRVHAEQEPTPRFPEPVEGLQLLEGKPVTSTSLEEDLPTVTQNNFRQLFALTPGLLVSEVSNGAWASLSYRGLGEPHESWNLLVLKDGLPVSPDLFSYPAAYYTPPSESLERIDFIRGGGGLLFGPQPGGALNYITRAPPLAAVEARAKVVAGSFGLLTAYGSVGGTVGRIAYLVDLNHFRNFEGPRERNSDSQTWSGDMVLTVDAQRATRYSLRFEGYGADFGEPGGLNRERFEGNRRQTSTPVDRFRPQRYVGTFRVQHDFSAATSVEVIASGGFYERTSRRQASTSFGVLANPDHVSVVQTQRFGTGTAQARLRHDWELGTRTQTLTAGLSLFGTHAPVVVNKGDAPDDDVGRAGALSRAERSTMALSLVAENAFRFGRWSLVPGVRFDLLRQASAESLDLQVGSPLGGAPGAQNGELGNRQALSPVLLPGLGLQFHAFDSLDVYGNVSRGYKPLLYTDGVAFQSGVTASSVLSPSLTTTTELGARGRAFGSLVYDVSAFYVNFENTVGLIGNDNGSATRTNVGRMVNFGGDIALEWDVLGFIRQQATNPSQYGRLVLFGSVQLLSARFWSGPLQGSRPQYAPPYVARAGVSYLWKDVLKVMALSTWLGSHSGVDNANPTFALPAYRVFDLSVEATFVGGKLSLLGGISNLFDEQYAARVRPGGGGGIDPGLPRNLYVGLSSRF